MTEQNTLLQTATLILTVGLLVMMAFITSMENNANEKLQQLEPLIVQTARQTSEMYADWNASKLREIPWEDTGTEWDYIEQHVNIPENSLLFFTSPNCGHCIAQEQVLKALQENYGTNYTKVCFGYIYDDWDECEADESYLLNNSISLAEKYQIKGIPSLVLNCSKKRLGTIAMIDEEAEYEDLKKTLIKEQE